MVNTMENNNTEIENNQDIVPLNDSIEIEREANGQLKKGVILNPKGKPKGARHFSTLIREAIKKVAEGESEPADILIVKQLVMKAKTGDLQAIDRVLDRVDGKAEQTINLDADIHTDEGLTQEQKEKLLELLK